MDNPELLLALVDRELAAVAAVGEALEAERAALDRRDAGALEAAAHQKAWALSAASRLEQERRELLAARPGLASDHAAVREGIRKLQELARRCRDQNEANGILIRAQRRRVDNALGLLRGVRGGAAGPETYGRDGSAVPGGRSKGRLASW